MGINSAIVLVFDKFKAWDVLEYIYRFTDAGFDGRGDAVSPMTGVLVASYFRDTGAVPLPYGGLRKLHYETCLFFQGDEKIRYYVDDENKSEQGRFRIGLIDLYLRFGNKHAMFYLKAVTTSMSRLFSASNSIRDWAIDLLRKYRGSVGIYDPVDGGPGVVFYINGEIVGEKAWPDASLDDPDELVEKTIHDPYTREKEEMLRAGLMTQPDHRRELLRCSMSQFQHIKIERDFSFVLVFDKSRAWEVLHSLNDIIEHYSTDRIDMQCFSKADFSFLEARFDLSLLFEVDDIIREWWECEKLVIIGKKQPAVAQSAIERIEHRMRSENLCPVGAIDLNVKFGREHVMFDFKATSYDMSALFNASVSVRKRFVGILRRYDGLVGVIDRGPEAGTLFYLDKQETDEETAKVISLSRPDEILQEIKKRRK